MTNLETVAAQRDELSMKLRALALDLEAANAEIARLRVAAPVAFDVSPASATVHAFADGGFVPPPPLVTPGTVHGELLPGEVWIEAEGGLTADAAATPPKPKRTGISGGKP